MRMRTEWEFKRRVGRRLWELSLDLKCLCLGLGYAWSSGTFFVALPFALLTGTISQKAKEQVAS